LFDRDQHGPLQFFDVVAGLSARDTEASPEGVQRWVATGIPASEAEQSDVAELGTRADAPMFEKPIGGKDSLENLVWIKRRSDLHRGYSCTIVNWERTSGRDTGTE
jgi:hypothetical protein